MIRLWYSNYLEALVGAMLDNVQALRDAGVTDPFDVTRVIVPNRNIATYLKFEIARRTGILANFQFDYLQRFFRRAIVAPDTQILGREDLHTLLLDVLMDEQFLGAPELDQVRGYLDAAQFPDARDRRVWQLAAELSTVFEEYTLSRPRLLSLWPKQTVLTEQPYAQTERWERAIWLELFRPGGRVEAAAERVNKRLVLLPDLFDDDKTLGQLPPQVHVFGLSYVARSFYKLFGKLAERTAVLVYTMNPCMEYWEDVPSGWRIGHARQWVRRGKEQALLSFAHEDEVIADDSPPALRAWGRPGRDNIFMLNMLTECDFASVFTDPLSQYDPLSHSATGKKDHDRSDTLLHRLQHDILVRQPVRVDPERTYDDDSLTVLACPNVQREVEVVANEILDLKRRYAEAGATLEFHEIAVIVNDAERDAYQARIRSVFRSTFDIPHNIIDITASAHRRFVEAVELLVLLPFGRFTRRELLRLLTHDNVVAACEGVNPQAWERWCHELNILHGADHADHDGTYIEGALYHWDQGLKRLVLGTFMTGAMSGEERVADVGGEHYLPFELSPQEVHSAAQFVQVARGLIADARALRKGRRPLGQWMKRIAELISTYLATVDEDDEFDRTRILRFLAELADRNLASAPVPFRIAQEFIRRNLASLEISRGQYLSEGVVVSSFLPMRPIPFKVVFVTGLGERFFPRSDVRSPLDLRWAPELAQSRGDVISARAQDEYMFLETLISTRDRFYMSFVARDGHTGEELEPSSVVRLLWFMLEQNYVAPDNLHKRWIHHPLRRWHARYFGEDAELVNVQQDAQREALTLQTRRDLEQFAAQHDLAFPDRSTLARGLTPEARDTMLTRLGLVDPPHPGDASRDDLRIDVAQVRRFLESPTQGTAAFHLGMRDDQFEDAYGVEDEVFESDHGQRATLLRQAFVSLLVETGGDFILPMLEARFDELFALEQLAGRVPSGPFGVADRAKYSKVLEMWLTNYRSLQLDGPPEVVEFGSGRGNLTATRRVEPLALDGGDWQATLSGRTTMLWPGRHVSMVLTASDHWQSEGPRERPFLAGFLDLAMLSAAETHAGQPWNVVNNVARLLDPKHHVRTFKPFTPEAARDWLTRIIDTMVAPGQTYFLPIEAVFAHAFGKGERTIDRWIEEMRSPWSHGAFRYGPLHAPEERFPAPPNPEAVIEHRFGAYLRRREEPEGE